MSTDNPEAALKVDADEALAAAESIERLANQYRHMVRAAETLKSVGMAANALREINAAIEAARAAKAEADEQVALVNQMLAELREQAALVLDKANEEAARIVEAAQAKAAKIVQDAVDRARKVAEEGAAEHETRMAKARETLNTIGEQIAAARQELEQLVTLRSAKAMELDKLESRLQAARAAAVKILTAQE